MTPFQWISLPILAVLGVWELTRAFRGTQPRTPQLLRCLVWLSAALAIAFPDLVQDAARAVGIGRGADAVLYLFVLLSIATWFYFYSRTVRLQRQITQLVRHMAIQEARRGHELPPEGDVEQHTGAPTAG